MHVYAHRGASIDRPENTLAAFAAALELGVEGIELDVVRSKDDQLVVIHDLTLDRTTNGTGPVRELTATEMGKLDAGDGEHVPTLAAVLELIGGRARVNIELKQPDLAGLVIEVVSDHPELEWFASGAHWEALAELRRQVGAVVYPLTLGRMENLTVMLDLGRRARQDFDAAAVIGELGPVATGLDDAIGAAVRMGAEGLSVWEHDLTADDIASVRDHGLQVWVWTVNDPARAAELIRLGVDAICTDDPAAVLDVRDQPAPAV